MKVAQSIQISQLQKPVDLIEIAERGQTKASGKSDPGSFKDMFSKELASSTGVSFSKHAEQRLYSRGIELSDTTLSKIADAIDRAGKKGSKETLILTDEAALVVSVNNRTVVTVFDRNNLREGVVTSIDSAVVL